MKRLALLTASLVVADGILYLGLRRLDSSRIFYDRSNAVSAHRLEFFAAHSYDAELGWDLERGAKNRLGGRRGARDPDLGRYQAKAFGDSFTFGSDVDSDETWPAFVERQTGWHCLNYGVPGYGTDQALLKYRRTPVPTDFTILGIQQENIGRLVSVYRAFYMEDWGPTKPRFIVEGQGLRLDPNPIGSREQLRRLLDPAFVEALRRKDYWARYNEDILGAPDRLRWPALWTVLRHGRFFLDRAALESRLRLRPSYQDEARRFKPYHLYQEASEALEILVRLIDAFAAECRQRGERPLVLIIPLQHTVDLMKTYGRCLYQPLTRRLSQRGVPHLDFGPVFVKERYGDYYRPYNGHLSPKGNQRVARQVVEALRRESSGAKGQTE